MPYSPAHQLALTMALWANYTHSPLTIVSANDHVHAGRGHYEDRALDVQGEDLDGLAGFLETKGYRVLWRVPGHFGHLHAEKAE